MTAHRWVPVVLAVAACGPDPEATIRRLAPEIAELTEERAANTAFLDAAARTPDTAVAFSPDDLQRLAADVLPLTLDAASFHKQLQGSIVVEQLGIPSFSAGNRVDATVRLRGERIRFTGNVPGAFKAEIARFIEGVQAGVDVRMRMRLAFEKDRLLVHATALQATLARNGGGSSESMLVDEMNQRALRQPIPFALDADPSLRPLGVLVTSKHLVLQYARSGAPAPAAPPPAVAPVPAPARSPAPAPTPTTPAPAGGPSRPRRPGG